MFIFAAVNNPQKTLTENSFFFSPGVVILENEAAVTDTSLPVTKTEFQTDAQELFNEFQDFKESATLSQSLGFNYQTQLADVNSITIDIIPTGTRTTEVEGINRTVNRFIMEYQDLTTFIPGPTNAKLTYRDNQYDVLSVMNPGDANAVLTIEAYKL